MTNARITLSNRPNVAAPEVAVIDAAAGEQELELASTGPSGVLRELALARWRGSASEENKSSQKVGKQTKRCAASDDVD